MSNNNDDIASKCHQLYLMSKKRMEEGDDPDLADEVIIALWNTVEDLNAKKKALGAIVDEQAQSLAAYYHKQDLLESRIAYLTGEKSLNAWQPNGEMQ